jgi:hypothetical protein
VSKPDIERLAAGDYTLLAAMTHAELAPFVVHYFLRRTSWLTRLHHLMTAATFAAIVYVAIRRDIPFLHCLAAFGLAFVALFVVLLPLHEGLHAVAYRLVGARDIRWGYSLRFLAFWVTAHRFVCERGPFIFVALAPFVVLNAALIAAAVMTKWTIFFLCMLLWHMQGVSGDWALLNFVWLHRERGFWTYDDSDSGHSFFYGRSS